MLYHLKRIFGLTKYSFRQSVDDSAEIGLTRDFDPRRTYAGFDRYPTRMRVRELLPGLSRQAGFKDRWSLVFFAPPTHIQALRDCTSQSVH